MGKRGGSIISFYTCILNEPAFVYGEDVTALGYVDGWVFGVCACSVWASAVMRAVKRVEKSLGLL